MADPGVSRVVSGTSMSRRRFLQSAVVGTGATVLTVGGGSFAVAQSSGAKPTGTIKIALQSEPVTLDPMFAEGVIEIDVCINVMDGLVTTGKDLKITPMLAESWKQIDSLTWEFPLRRGVTFQNGEPFTAQSVKATYDRSVDPKVKARNTWGSDVNLKEVEIVDDYTVRFHTSEPTPHMLARLSNDHFMYPPKYLADNYNNSSVLAGHPIGTGAYVFKNWRHGQSIVLEANPNYWGDQKPSIQTVEWSWIPEDTTRVANLETGAVDFIQAVPPASVSKLKADSKVQLVIAPPTRRDYFGFNTKLKPVDDVRVRQAINYGTDIELICKTILAGATTRMNNWTNPPYQNPAVKGYTYDPNKAKQLLAQAGYSGGATVTADYDPNGGTIGINEFPQAIATSLKEVGVNLQLKAMDSHILTAKERSRTTDQMYFRTNAGYFDPGLTFDVLRPDHAGNGTNWNDPQFQALRDKLYTGGTPEQRRQWSYQAQVILMDQAPFLFLWKEPQIFGLGAQVQGFAPNGDERIRVWPLSLKG